MYERILVALDGSKLGEQVLPYVRLLARGFNSQIELFRVIEPLPPAGLTDPAHDPFRHRLLESLKEDAEKYLGEVAVSLHQDGFEAFSVVQGGEPLTPPFHYILSEAEKDPTTLIALSTHGRKGIGRWALGSVAERVLHSTTSPLLLVRARGEAPAVEPKLENVIVTLDGSNLAEQILPYVTPLAKALDLKLLLVRVTRSPGEYHRYAGGQPRGEAGTSFLVLYEEFSETTDTEAKNYLHEMAARLKGEGIAAVEEHLLHGNPAEEIVGLTRGTPNSLVAMTSHGRTGIQRWVLGSVADRVVRDCGDPVLLVRAAV